jgi:hypothetical protein
MPIVSRDSSSLLPGAVEVTPEIVDKLPETALRRLLLRLHLEEERPVAFDSHDSFNSHSSFASHSSYTSAM